MKDQVKKLVAVVVPIPAAAALSQDEKTSYRQLLHYLGKYDKYLIAPPKFEIHLPGFGIKRFKKKYFGSAAAHTRLLLSSTFYNAFKDYRFILIYHFDALVFSDQLEYWCEKDYDYIGPPWINHKDAPYKGSHFEGKVGNGGFSLRKIESFLEVINSSRLRTETNQLKEMYFGTKSSYWNPFNFMKILLKRVGVHNNSRFERYHYPENEDSFWALRANHYYPDFKIPPLEIALKFAFECFPRYCFQMNGNKLPFGCHAWPKYDRAFWEPHLIS